MTLNAHPFVTEAGKPIASGQRRFSTYALHALGAVIGACATIFTLSVVPAGIADASSLYESMNTARPSAWPGWRSGSSWSSFRSQQSEH